MERRDCLEAVQCLAEASVITTWHFAPSANKRCEILNERVHKGLFPYLDLNILASTFSVGCHGGQPWLQMLCRLLKCRAAIQRHLKAFAFPPCDAREWKGSRHTSVSVELTEVWSFDQWNYKYRHHKITSISHVSEIVFQQYRRDHLKIALNNQTISDDIKTHATQQI